VALLKKNRELAQALKSWTLRGREIHKGLYQEKLEKLKDMEIYYATDPIPEYNKAIDKAKDQNALIAAIEPFKLIAADALIAAKTPQVKFNWKKWRKGLKVERGGEFAGEEWAKKFGSILLPEVMFRVSLVAEHFGVPWGVAYIQMKRAGIIKAKNGVAKVVIDVGLRRGKATKNTKG
jgi:hypothetical protein